MTIETELKLRVDSHEPVRQRLRAEGAVFISRVLETNHILDTADRSLFRRGCGLRVRSSIDLKNEHPPQPPKGAVFASPRRKPRVATAGETEPLQGAALSPGKITFKGPKKPGVIRSREEIELDVADAGALLHLLRELGYEPFLIYQKRRESWTLGSCEVELDEPPHLGLFVEIEGPDEPAIRAVQSRLALRGAEEIWASYVRLLLSQCDGRGLSPLGLLFE